METKKDNEIPCDSCRFNCYDMLSCNGARLNWAFKVLCEEILNALLKRSSHTIYKCNDYEEDAADDR